MEVTGNGPTQILEARAIVLATGSEARMLPGLQPDPQHILTNVEILDLPQVPENHGDPGRGRGRRRVRLLLPSLRQQSLAVE